MKSFPTFFQSERNLTLFTGRFYGNIPKNGKKKIENQRRHLGGGGGWGAVAPPPPNDAPVENQGLNSNLLPIQ